MAVKCDACGSTDVMRIVYGEVGFPIDPRVDDDGHMLMPGGCCVSEDSPAWACSACSSQFGVVDDRHGWP